MTYRDYMIGSNISIHAPREGGDAAVSWCHFAAVISIHAPREGGDFVWVMIQRAVSDFNPRPPRGGRHGGGSATTACGISIHAPREGGDL